MMENPLRIPSLRMLSNWISMALMGTLKTKANAAPAAKGEIKSHALLSKAVTLAVSRRIQERTTQPAAQKNRLRNTFLSKYNFKLWRLSSHSLSSFIPHKRGKT